MRKLNKKCPKPRRTYSERVWRVIRAGWEAGIGPTDLSRLWGPGASTISKRANSEGWIKGGLERDVYEQLAAAQARYDARQSAMAELSRVDAKDLPADPPAELVNRAELLEGENISRELPSRSPLTAEERQSAIEARAELMALVLRDHRDKTAAMRRLWGQLMAKLEDLVERGEAANLLEFKTKGGNKRYRIDFLGDRESVTDVLEKLSRVLQRVISMERTCFGLDADDTDGKPPLQVNIGIMQGPQPAASVELAGQPARATVVTDQTGPSCA